MNKIALYMRLSRDDEKSGESVSIENQRIILRKYAEEKGGTVIDEYVDDGFSGTSFDRPAVKRLLEDAKSGKIDTVIVKDLSRFGRNYIEVGQYIDYIFPAYGIRFIALNDNVDTADRASSAMDMMPIMNVFNEWHAANTSKKIRAVLEASQRSGKYTNWSYPYGYKAGTDENRTAVIDECAAAVVRRIFDLRLQGYSYRAVARLLTDEGIPNPATYFTRLDGGKWNRDCSPHWVAKTVMEILSNPTYIGYSVQHKTTRVSYKNHKVVKTPKSERIIKENAHAPIVSFEVWEKVQALKSDRPRGRADKTNKVHPLSGLLVCADCGKKLKRKSCADGHIFVCRTYADLGNKYCTSHGISEKTLESLVLSDIKSMSSVAFDEAKEKERFMKLRAKHCEKDTVDRENRLKARKSRLSECEKLLAAAFEEKVLGNMPENVCLSLCKKYQAEIGRIVFEIAELESLDAKNAADGADEYITKLVRYGNCTELTREMCLQLIRCIVVGEKKADDTPRDIRIYYNFAPPTDPYVT